jgi:hypothetical protein
MAAVLLLSTAACQKPETKAVVPEVFRVKFQTSEGDFIVEASRAWAPRGADRFHELVNMRYFDEGRFFRVVNEIRRSSPAEGAEIRGPSATQQRSLC